MTLFGFIWLVFYSEIWYVACRYRERRAAGVGKFCQECGAPMGPSNCPSCSKPVASGAKFCGECGTKL